MENSTYDTIKNVFHAIFKNCDITIVTKDMMDFKSFYHLIPEIEEKDKEIIKIFMILSVRLERERAMAVNY